jgi:hypothetical protein
MIPWLKIAALGLDGLKALRGSKDKEDERAADIIDRAKETVERTLTALHVVEASPDYTPEKKALITNWLNQNLADARFMIRKAGQVAKVDVDADGLIREIFKEVESILNTGIKGGKPYIEAPKPIDRY